MWRYLNIFNFLPMKGQILLLLLTFSSIICYSQINYETGYFINNSNQKVDCLIRNVNLKINPTEFEFKLTEDAEIQKASIQTIQEFHIYGKFKYIRQNVMIDQSEKSIDKLSRERKALLEEQEVFLRVLIEGKASLYSFENSKFKRFFYSLDDSKIEQLIFKEYLNDDRKISQNNMFKQQLLDDLKCSTIKKQDAENVNYRKNELITFFVKYNECNNTEFTNFEEKQKRDLFNLNLRPGINSASLSIENSTSRSNAVDFNDKIGFRFGIEVEFILPIYNNKWAFTIEPTYQYFKTKETITSSFATRNFEVDYKSIEVPVGIRHYIFLNKNSKLFINGAFVFDLSSNSSINELTIGNSSNFAFGLGFKQNDKYSIELRYQPNRNILTDYVFWSSNYTTASVIFGYTLF